jgi:hypothetical protein
MPTARLASGPKHDPIIEDLIEEFHHSLDEVFLFLL